MKLRYQGYVLIGIPLLFELVFVAILLSVIVDLQAAAGREAHAKQVVSKCDELRNYMASSYMTFVSMRLSGSQTMMKVYDDSMNKLKKQLIELKALTLSDPEKPRRLVTDYCHTVDHVIKLLDEVNNAYMTAEPSLYYAPKPGFMAFISEKEFLEEFSAYLQRQTEQAIAINACYAPLVQEFQPQAAHKRNILNAVIIAGVFMNVLIAIVLARVLARGTVLRLDKLMSNIDRFAVGEVVLEPVGGTDEIAALDKKFREIAIARNASDDMRRSILAMVSHDMRTPLTSLCGYLDMAVQKVYGDPGPKLERILSRVHSEALRLIRLSNDLLDTERIQAANFELNLEDNFLESIADQAINAIRALAEANEIEVKVKIPDELSLPCDSDRITQILVNFLSNAIKFSPKGADVWLKAATAGDGATVRVEVIDKGPGISPDQKPLVFEKFKQLTQPTETRREGSGLGLAICKALVEKHGGKIGVDSVEGEGSCFWFELPGSRLEISPAAKKSETKEPDPSDKR